MGRSYRSKTRQRKRSSKKASNGPEKEVERAAVLPLAMIAVVILIIGGAAYLYLSNLGSDEGDEKDDDDVQNDPGNGVQTGPLFIPLENIEGGNLKLNDMKGRVIVLDMMATWCGPCKLQMEELRELRTLFSSYDVEIVSVGVDLKEAASLLRGFKTDENADWPFVRSNQAFNDAFPVDSIPTLYILDKNGRVAKTHVGVTEVDVLSSEVASLLA